MYSGSLDGLPNQAGEVLEGMDPCGLRARRAAEDHKDGGPKSQFRGGRGTDGPPLEHGLGPESSKPSTASAILGRQAMSGEALAQSKASRSSKPASTWEEEARPASPERGAVGSFSTNSQSVASGLTTEDG